MHTPDLKKEISRLLDQQIQCVLATFHGDQPCQHMMAFAFSEDLARIYLATYKDTRKYGNMISNPCVSMLWDNRTGSADDHLNSLSLIALGRAELLIESSQVDVRAALLRKNPTLKALLDDERCRLFAVSVDDYVWTQGYQKVLRYAISQEHQGL